MLMTSGLRAAAAAMSVQLLKQDVYATNLANANTVGYRRADLAVGSFAQALAQAAVEPAAQATLVDVAQGPIRETGDPFDLAINGPGMFAILTPAGIRYTRDGRFQRAPDGSLRTLSGQQVMGRAGPIVLPGMEITVTERGQIFSGGKFVDELLIAQVGAADRLVRTPDGLFLGATESGLAPDATIRQGCLEQANVTVVREMVQMLSSLRAFEASATALRVTDQTLDRLIDLTQG